MKKLFLIGLFTLFLSVKSVSAENDTSIEGPGWTPVFNIAYGFLPKIEGLKGSNYTYTVNAGANYWFTNQLKGIFAGVRIGYESSNTHQYSQGNSIDVNSHFFNIPAQLGFAIANKKKSFALIPYIGADFDISVKSKSKSKINGEEVSKKGKSGKLAIDFRLGSMLRFGSINIGAFYSIPVNDDRKYYFGEDSYWGINFGFGF